MVQILDGRQSTEVGVGVGDVYTFAEGHDADFEEHIA